MKRILATICLVFMFCIYPLSANAQGEVDMDAMLDKHGATMMIIDPDTGNILYANNAAVAFYGYSPEQLKSMNIMEINTLSSEEITQEMQAAADESRNYFVFKHRLANGETRDVEIFSYPIQYEGKQALFSIIHDVSEKMILQEQRDLFILGILIAGAVVITILTIMLIRMHRNHENMKKAIQEMENFNLLRKTFIDADSNMVYLKDENLKYVFVNQAFRDYFNVTDEEIIGIDDFALSEPIFAQMKQKTDKAALEQMNVVTDEVEWNSVFYRTTKFPVRMLNGCYGVGAYVKNATEEYVQRRKREKIYQRNRILLEVFSRSFNNRQEQLDYVLHRALDMTESRYGYIYLYDENTHVFELNSWTRGVMESCSVVDRKTKYQLEKTGLWGEVVRQRKSIVVNDFEKPNPLKKGYPEGHVQLKKFMSVPVVIDDQIVAVIGLANKEQDYDDDDVYQITLLMNGIWNAVQRREAQEQLAYERNRYLQTLISIGDGVMIVDQQGKIDMLNEVAQKLTGWTDEQAHGKHYTEVFILSHEDPDEHINDPIADVFRTDCVQELGNHAMLTSKNGGNYYLEDSAAPIRNEDGKSVGVVLVFRDVTEKRDQRKKIEYLSFHDELTGLYNRRFFEEELLRMDLQENLPISIIMGDVNGLKLTNDIFGHSYGDMLLKNIANVFRSVCRASDVIARWGGDEFVLLLPATGIQEAAEIVSKIKHEFAKKRVKSIKGSISMGIECKDRRNQDIFKIIDNAESKMYSSKTLEHRAIREGAIQEIMDTLYENSKREKEHSDQVSRLSVELGKKLKLSEESLRKLKEAAYLHDIGKIVLDSKLLDLAYKPISKEWTEIKQHPIVGYRILYSFDRAVDLAEIILAHHERWDGTGYPKGLKHEEIPLLSRIIAVVESYDRMVNASMSQEDIIRDLRENAGAQFDPEIAEIFIEMILLGDV